MRQLLKLPLSNTLITNIALLPAVNAAIKAGTALMALPPFTSIIR